MLISSPKATASKVAMPWAAMAPMKTATAPSAQGTEAAFGRMLFLFKLPENSGLQILQIHWMFTSKVAFYW